MSKINVLKGKYLDNIQKSDNEVFETKITERKLRHTSKSRIGRTTRQVHCTFFRLFAVHFHEILATKKLN